MKDSKRKKKTLFYLSIFDSGVVLSCLSLFGAEISFAMSRTVHCGIYLYRIVGTQENRKAVMTESIDVALTDYVVVFTNNLYLFLTNKKIKFFFGLCLKSHITSTTRRVY